MDMFVRSHRFKKSPILISLSDLNLARAFNRLAFGDEEVQLTPQFNKTFQIIKKKFPKNESTGDQRDRNVMVKFGPHRVSPDQFETGTGKFGPQRLEAVQCGSYQIYPCCHEKNLDALEVRYADGSGKRKDVAINHEIFLDYGVEEAMAYVRNAVALQETFRLFPAVLAEVDPQAFWSAILWLKQFIETLNELNISSELIEEWTAIKKGREKSKMYFEESMDLCHFDGPLKGPEENWGITKSKDVHLRIGTDYAICAVEAVQTAVRRNKNISSITVNTLSQYMGTELDSYITGMSKFLELGRIERDSNEEGEISEKRTAELYNQAMKSVGFGKDSKFRLKYQDPEKVCDSCGKKSKKKLLTCARCEGVSYCDAKCQKEHWKVHRSTCSRIYVQCQKMMARMNINGEGGPNVISTRSSTPGLLPTEPVMFSETSAIGSVSIMWNPGSTSCINSYPLSNLEDMVSGKLKPDVLKNSLRFNNLADLHPTVRFLLCCGPLPHLGTAKQSVSDALSFCNGNLDSLRVPNVGFTALEWASKKGNIEIVQWLCTDKRTKELVHIGCPVGWAGYTGQIDVMRFLVGLGADPSATDAILWGATPPLMVAAQNGKLESLKFYVDKTLEC